MNYCYVLVNIVVFCIQILIKYDKVLFYFVLICFDNPMGLLPDTKECGLRMRRECRARFPHHCELATPTCITERA